MKTLHIPKLLSLFLLSLLLVSCSSDSDDDSGGGNGGPDVSANRRPLGTSANDLLSSTNFTSVRIEVGYVEGFRPEQTAIDNLRQFIAQRMNKPGGVGIKETIVPATQNGTLDTDEIVAIENEYRTVYNNGDQIAVWVFFADQNSEKDEGNSVLLGTAYRNTSLVVYEKTIKEINMSVTGSDKGTMEGVTLRHEFGHLLGLVSLGSDMQVDHEDTANPRHCNVEGCLMYYETVADAFSMLGLQNIPPLDDLCIADLQANGGK